MELRKGVFSSLCFFVFQCYTEHEECSTDLTGPKTCCNARVCMRRAEGWRCITVFWPHLDLHRHALTSAWSAPTFYRHQPGLRQHFTNISWGCTDILLTSARDAPTFYWHQLGMHRHLQTSARSAPIFTDISRGCTNIYQYQPCTDIRRVCTNILLTPAGNTPTFTDIN